MTYEKGKIYTFDGNDFVEIEPSGEQKLPVTEDATKAVRAVRKAAQKLIGLRPELSLVASAMLLAAADLPDIAERVKTFGKQFYAD